MGLFQIILLIAILGAFGGIANCAVSGEFVLPHYDSATNIWRIGWAGNVLIGAIAAVLVCCSNGSFASVDLMNMKQPVTITFTLAQLVSSIAIGFGGGNILTQMSQKQAERVAKNTLASTLEDLT